MGLTLKVLFSVAFFAQFAEPGQQGFDCNTQSRECVHESGDFNQAISTSWQQCQLLCPDRTGIWPTPTGLGPMEKLFLPIDLDRIEFNGAASDKMVESLEELKKIMIEKLTKRRGDNEVQTVQRNLSIQFAISDEALEYGLGKEEDYMIKVSGDGDGNFLGRISAQNFFGARHAVETLSKIIVFDDIRNMFVLPVEFYVSDKPVFGFRGVLLEEFWPKERIQKELIDRMSILKMNVLQWRFADCKKFPLQLPSHPEMTMGDVSYTKEDIEEIVNYALFRGVHIIPEFIIPAGAGKGWEKTNVTLCVPEECPENGNPGFVDPSNPKTYDILEQIFEDVLDMFKYPLIYHVGGYVSNFDCWNNNPNVSAWMKDNKFTDVDALVHFDKEVLKRVTNIASLKSKTILWGGRGVDQFHRFGTERTIIQIDQDLSAFIFKTIFDTNLKLILTTSGVFGEEVPFNVDFLNYGGHDILDKLFGVMVDRFTADDIESYIKPVALAERMWSNPNGQWDDFSYQANIVLNDWIANFP